MMVGDAILHAQEAWIAIANNILCLIIDMDDTSIQGIDEQQPDHSESEKIQVASCNACIIACISLSLRNINAPSV